MGMTHTIIIDDVPHACSLVTNGGRPVVELRSSSHIRHIRVAWLIKYLRDGTYHVSLVK
jgi:hypothetical protein